MINNKTILTHKSFTMQVFMCVTTPSFPVYLSTVKKAKKAKKSQHQSFKKEQMKNESPILMTCLNFKGVSERTFTSNVFLQPISILTVYLYANTCVLILTHTHT